MAANVAHRMLKWFRLIGRPDVQMLGGGPLLLVLIAWWIESPHRLGRASCEGLAVLMLAGYHVWMRLSCRRWNLRAIAAHRAGVFDMTPPSHPRGEMAILFAGLGFALTGLFFLIRDVLSFWALRGEPPG